MIAQLTGRVDALEDGRCVIDVNGVGYLVHASTRTLAALPASAEPARLFVETQVREDAIVLYGFLDKAALQDTFGLILTVIILLEFNHSIYVALTHHTGAIQARIVVLVIARKLMLQDISALDFQTLLGFGGLLLALGGLYWLISDGDRRHARAIPVNPPDG